MANLNKTAAFSERRLENLNERAAFSEESWDNLNETVAFSKESWDNLNETELLLGLSVCLSVHLSPSQIGLVSKYRNCSPKKRGFFYLE